MMEYFWLSNFLLNHQEDNGYHFLNISGFIFFEKEFFWLFCYWHKKKEKVNNIN